MKRTHACPKCGCTQIVHVPASQWLFARGGNAYLGLHLGEKVLISKYICTGCLCGRDSQGYREYDRGFRHLQTEIHIQPH